MYRLCISNPATCRDNIGYWIVTPELSIYSTKAEKNILSDTDTCTDKYKGRVHLHLPKYIS